MANKWFRLIGGHSCTQNPDINGIRSLSMLQPVAVLGAAWVGFQTRGLQLGGALGAPGWFPNPGWGSLGATRVELPARPRMIVW